MNMNMNIGHHLAQLVLNGTIVPFSSKEDLLLHSQITTRFSQLKLPGERVHKMNMISTVQVMPNVIHSGGVSQALTVTSASNFHVKPTHGAGHLSATTADTFTTLVEVWTQYVEALREAFAKGPSVFADSVIIVRDQDDLQALRTYAHVGRLGQASAIYVYLMKNGGVDIKLPFYIQFSEKDGNVVLDEFPITWNDAQNTKQDIMPLINHLFLSKDIAPQLVQYWTDRRIKKL